VCDEEKKETSITAFRGNSVCSLSSLIHYFFVLLISNIAQSIPPMLQPLPVPPSLHLPHNPNTFRLALSRPAVFRPLDTCAANVARTSGFFFRRS